MVIGYKVDHYIYNYATSPVVYSVYCKHEKRDGKAVLVNALILDYTLGLEALPEILI